MRIILNLVPVCSGGGQQQAFHLMRWLASQDQAMRDRWYLLVGRGSLLEQHLQKVTGLHWGAVERSYLSRVRFELLGARTLIRAFGADVVLHFTTAWIWSPVPQVVRTVYSNLYFPEIDFWDSSSFVSYFRRKVIDWFRLSGTLRADGLIFENRAMQRRVSELFGFSAERTRYVAPSFSSVPTFACEEAGMPGKDLRVLYLTTWHLNKNLHLLPAVAADLKRRGVKVCFVLTVDPSMQEVQSHILEPARALGVVDCFELVGGVHPNGVATLIRASDVMILLSQLECFSANVTEAWTYGRPLVISKLEWATVECGDAAYYVDRSDAESIAGALEELASRPDLRNELVSKGYERLKEFNTHSSRFHQWIGFLESIRELGKKR